MTRGQRRVCAMLTTACGALMAGCGDSSTVADATQIEHGRQLLARYHCGSCHAIPGVAASQGSFAASLNGYGKRSYIAGRVANEPAALTRWIVDPAAIVPGTLMPNMGVAPADARDMAAYLGQLR
jgi:cytochrome c